MMAKKKVRKEKKIEKTIKKNDRYEKQTKIAIILMIVLIISILLINWAMQERKKFEYHGLKFYIEKEGAITYYKTNMFASINERNIPFILKLRNDPRKLNKIPITGIISSDTLGKEVILSVDSKLGNCSNTYITLLDFGGTLKNLGIHVTKASTDKEYAKENDVLQATCKTTLEKGIPVILIEEGNQTELYKHSFYDKCYVLQVNNCEIQEAFERFLIWFIEGSKL